MSVVEAVERDLAELAKRDPDLAESSLAAAALALAAEVDAGGNSANAKAMCAKELREALSELRSLAPAEKGADKVDELGSRRAKRLARAAKA